MARYGGSSLVSSVSAIRDPAGQLLALQDNSSNARYYPLYDYQGSVVRLVDANGNTVDSYSYDPYGTKTTSTNTYPQPFGYTGAYTNPTTGLIHFGARFYDPTLGRFTQPGPQTHPGDISQSSPYPYAGNDPINNTDASGADLLDDALTVTSDVLTAGADIADVAAQAEIGEGLGLAASAVDAGHGLYDQYGGGDGDPDESYVQAGSDLVPFGLGKRFGRVGAGVGDAVSSLTAISQQSGG